MERGNQFVGQSGAFLDAVERASRAAPMRRPVLVVGERGTGKELIAERLHRLSTRWDEPLVVMNCAALPEDSRPSSKSFAAIAKRASHSNWSTVLPRATNKSSG